METIVELITENCATVEARVFLKHLRYSLIAVTIILSVACKNDRTIQLFDIPEERTTVFELLMHPERLSGIKIGGDIYYLQWYTKYKVKRVEDELLIEIIQPLRKKISE